MLNWRLGRRPSLDGLRAVAITLVTVSHLAAPSSRVHHLGVAGVVVFFALSGFLITALLLEELDDSGRLDVPAFYLRRARRLVPALLALVAALSAASWALPGLVTGRTALAALTYSTNWFQVATGAHDVDALSHTWSLAIEEQFYLAWPLALLGLMKLPRRWQGRALAAITVVAAVVPLRYDLDHWVGAYAGTDARAFPLLAGCLLAWRVHHRGAALRGSGLVCAAALVAVAALADAPFGFELYVAPQIVALLTALVVWQVVSGPGVPWLAAGPLVWLGQRSYGLYLWHLPALAVVQRYTDSRAASAGALVAALGIACLSRRYIEFPVLRRGRIADGITERPSTSPVAIAAPPC